MSHVVTALLRKVHAGGLLDDANALMINWLLAPRAIF